MSQREQETIYCAWAYQSLSETLTVTQRIPTHPRNSLKSIRKESDQAKQASQIPCSEEHTVSLCHLCLSKGTIQLRETLAILVQSQQAETRMKSNFPSQGVPLKVILLSNVQSLACWGLLEMYPSYTYTPSLLWCKVTSQAPLVTVRRCNYHVLCSMVFLISSSPHVNKHKSDVRVL